MLRRYLTLTSAWTVVLSLSALVMASPGTPAVVNPGVRIGEWIYTNVTALFGPILALVSIYYLAKRQFTRFISFAVFAVLVSLLVFAGSDFRDAAVSFTRWIIGR